MNTDELLRLPAYGLPQAEKDALYSTLLTDLTEHHRRNCPPYARLLDALGYPDPAIRSAQDAAPQAGTATPSRTAPEAFSYLPVSLFKELELKSVPEEEVFKELQSSGTTGQSRSRIVLDRETSALQQHVLYNIVTDFTGQDRMPYLVLDTRKVLKDRSLFSARGAGILGFSIFARDTCYALDEEMRLNLPEISAFLEKHAGKPILLFGFTFMVWQYVVRALEDAGRKLDLENGILIHGGGWKKMQNEAVSPEVFKERLQKVTGITRVHNYYGMAEQTGSIYMECECGHLHASTWSDVIMRRPEDFSPCGIGEKGLIEVISPIARSYPGHILLTEDTGILLGVDDCPCGRKGKYFRVTGRTPRAEVRGCSDTFERPGNSATGSGAGTAANITPVSTADTAATRIPDSNPENSAAVELLAGVLQPVCTPRAPFPPDCMDFLNALSEEIRRSDSRSEEMAALAFWCRKSNLKQMQAKSRLHRDMLGKGLVFHITPANVPLMFAYSYALGLLAGNANIVRISERAGDEALRLCGIFDRLLQKEEFAGIRAATSFIRYERNDAVTASYMDRCDVRVIWGGDSSVRALRRFALRPEAVELVFPDRFSVAVLDPAYLSAGGPEAIRSLAHRFYNDTYVMDQNGCASPKMVFWLSHPELASVRNAWWTQLAEEAAQRYPIDGWRAVRKLEASCVAAMKYGRDGTDQPETQNPAAGNETGASWIEALEQFGGNRVCTARMHSLPSDPSACEGRFGLFYEMEIDRFEDLAPILTAKCQTIVYAGEHKAELAESIRNMQVPGGYRITEPGAALQMDVIWDGQNLIHSLSRIISVD